MNNQQNLGLPLEYQQMPEYFDAQNVNVEMEVNNALIERLLNAHNVKSVLDMTCGTGSQVFYLHQRGYEIIGSDFSSPLIRQAREKARSRGVDIRFLEGDMRELEVGKFDAVISIFNAIGHLSKWDFAKALKNIRANLKDGGIYIFDIFNLEAISDKVIQDFDMEIESTVNGVKIKHTQHSEVDRENSLLTSHDHYTIFKESEKLEIRTNTFHLQIYTAQELKDLLMQNGFETVYQCDMNGKGFVADKSLSVLTVARKRG